MKQKRLTKKDLQISFRIEKIEIINFSIDNSPKHQVLPLEHPYSIEIKAGIALNDELKIIGIDLNIVVYATAQKDDIVCELLVRHNFKVENFSEIVTLAGNRFTLPDKVIEHFVALAYSTSRGIFFEKVQGSFLANFILPVLDITKFKRTENSLPHSPKVKVAASQTILPLK